MEEDGCQSTDDEMNSRVGAKVGVGLLCLHENGRDCCLTDSCRGGVL